MALLIYRYQRMVMPMLCFFIYHGNQQLIYVDWGCQVVLLDTLDLIFIIWKIVISSSKDSFPLVKILHGPHLSIISYGVLLDSNYLPSFYRISSIIPSAFSFDSFKTSTAISPAFRIYSFLQTFFKAFSILDSIMVGEISKNCGLLYTMIHKYWLEFLLSDSCSFMSSSSSFSRGWISAESLPNFSQPILLGFLKGLVSFWVTSILNTILLCSDYSLYSPVYRKQIIHWNYIVY